MRDRTVREVVEGLTDPIKVGEGKEDIVTAIVKDSREEVETPSPVFCP